MIQVAPQLKSQLRELSSRTSDPLGGFVYFIGLEELRSDLGARWESKRELIDSVARKTIRATIDEGDLFLAYGECEYVILFGNLARERALLKCSLIKADILRQFRGDLDLSALDIGTKVASLTDGEVEQVSLQDLLAAWREEEHGPLDDEISEALDKESIDRLRPRPETPSSSPDGGSAKRPLGQDESDGINGYFMWGDPGAQNEEPSSPAHAIFAPRAHHLDGVEIGFAPLVLPAKRAVSIFQCTPYRPDEFGSMATGYDVLDPTAPESDIIDVDRLAFERGRIALAEMLKRNTRAVVTISLSFETLSRSTRRHEILGKIAEIPPEFRRYLVINLQRFPDGMPSSRLMDICLGLKQLVRGLTAEVDPECQDLTKYKTAGIQCVGFQLFQRYPKPATRHRWISRFPWKATKFDLTSVIWGIRTPAELAEAAQAGFEYIGGDAIGPFSESPGPARTFQFPDTPD